MNHILYELPSNCDFSLATNNSTTSSDCSPILTEGLSSTYEGILINEQENVIWPQNTDNNKVFTSPNGDVHSPIKLMVCGLVRLPYNTMGLNGSFSESLIIVAVDKNSAKTYSGKLLAPDIKPKKIIPNFDFSLPAHEEKSNSQNTSLTGNYFNIDLVANLGVPVENATYNVYATLGDYSPML